VSSLGTSLVEVSNIGCMKRGRKGRGRRGVPNNASRSQPRISIALPHRRRRNRRGLGHELPRQPARATPVAHGTPRRRSRAAGNGPAARCRGSRSGRARAHQVAEPAAGPGRTVLEVVPYGNPLRGHRSRLRPAASVRKHPTQAVAPDGGCRVKARKMAARAPVGRRGEISTPVLTLSH
jgi:hypothetical protein